METFFLPFRGHYIIYRPLNRLAFAGNQAMVDYIKAREANPDSRGAVPEIEAFLGKAGFWSTPNPPAPPCNGGHRKPAMAVLLMTNRCNLACTYCYAAAGEGPTRSMSMDLARAVIDTAADNARQNGDSSFGLSFHGGGEPTVNWKVLREATGYARTKEMPCECSLASNGIWSAEQTRFICENFNTLTISADGIQEVHDRQRPRRSGAGSFTQVLASVRALDEAEVSYGIRMTIEPDALDTLTEGVRFWSRETGVKTIQIEISFTSGRGDYLDPKEEDGSLFAEAFLEAARAGYEHGVFVYYSGARPWVISHAFCQAPTQALIATPEGHLVSCFEMTGPTHPYASEFTIGRISAEKGVEMDAEALQRFEDSQRGRRKSCESCFCYWHCCGDCASRALASPAPGSVRCHINRSITRDLIAGYIQQGGGIWSDAQPAACRECGS